MGLLVDGLGLTTQRWRGHKTQWEMKGLYHPQPPRGMTLRECGQAESKCRRPRRVNAASCRASQRGELNAKEPSDQSIHNVTPSV
jgi:hypothetical protein